VSHNAARPVSPDAGEAQGHTEPLSAAGCWRTGRKVGRTIYAQQGQAPSDSDPLIGVMDRPEWAAEAAVAVSERRARQRGQQCGAPATAPSPAALTAPDQIPDEVVDAAKRADMDGRSHARAYWAAVPTAQVRRLIAGAVGAYENAITWNTCCLSCATLLDSCYAETTRREQAEAKLAAVAELARQLGDRSSEPALPAPLVKVHLPLSDRRIVEPIRRRLLEILEGTGD
jgi:hypothetical protein